MSAPQTLRPLLVQAQPRPWSHDGDYPDDGVLLTIALVASGVGILLSGSALSRENNVHGRMNDEERKSSNKQRTKTQSSRQSLARSTWKLPVSCLLILVRTLV